MAQQKGGLTLEALKSVARSAGLSIEQGRLQQILEEMRSMLEELYEVDEQTLREVEPFHILPLPEQD